MVLTLTVYFHTHYMIQSKLQRKHNYFFTTFQRRFITFSAIFHVSGCRNKTINKTIRWIDFMIHKGKERRQESFSEASFASISLPAYIVKLLICSNNCPFSSRISIRNAWPAPPIALESFVHVLPCSGNYFILPTILNLSEVFCYSTLIQKFQYTNKPSSLSIVILSKKSNNK